MGSEHNFSTNSPLFKKLLANIRKNVHPEEKPNGDCTGYVYLDRKYVCYKCSKCRLRVDFTVDPPDVGKGNIVEYAHKRKMS